MPRKIFTNGDVLPASDVNTYLMDQAVMTFTNSTARSTAIPTPIQGMVTYLTASDEYQYWDGTAWVAFGGGGDAVLVEY
jgi:hypothetical protein